MKQKTLLHVRWYGGGKREVEVISGTPTGFVIEEDSPSNGKTLQLYLVH